MIGLDQRGLIFLAAKKPKPPKPAPPKPPKGTKKPPKISDNPKKGGPKKVKPVEERDGLTVMLRKQLIKSLGVKRAGDFGIILGRDKNRAVVKLMYVPPPVVSIGKHKDPAQALEMAISSCSLGTLIR